VAKQFEDAGIKRLHLVDLDGAKQKRIVNRNVLENISKHTNLQIDFGGGIQSDTDIEIAFECGAKQVTGGSVAIKNPELFEKWLQKYGPEKIILGADAKNKMIAVSGWQEQTTVPIFDFLEDKLKKGIKYTICTDVAKDGLLEGPSIELYKEIGDRFTQLNLIASGGVSNIEDLEKLMELNVYGVIIGKAIYENRISLTELQRFL
jgi:phosphoribosylformimino-5-aminoimidazole carboxamide ribotide isomerase